jgi:hypothetical protein
MSEMASDIDTHLIEVTFFPDKFARGKSCAELTLPQLATFIGMQTAASKLKLPWIKLARFGDKKSAANCLRTNDNTLAITGIEAEHDAGEVSFDEAVALMREARIRCLIYTSPSWMAGTKEKWRVLAPTSKEHPPEARARLVARINGLFKGAITDECFVLSQAFLFGHLGDAAHHEVVLGGDFVDLRDDLDLGAMGKSTSVNSATDRSNPKNRCPRPDGEVSPGRTDAEIAALLELSREQGKWHNSMLSATASMIGRGWSDDQIYEATAPYCRDGWGDDDIAEMVKSARTKWRVLDEQERHQTLARLAAGLGAGAKASNGAGTAGAGIGADDAGAGEKSASASPPISATPYVWTDPTDIPMRDWLYGRLLIRKFVTATVAPGGLGKSSLITVEALAQVSGKALLGVEPSGRLRVWLWNLEDPQEETRRKIQAAAAHHELTAEDIGNRLFVDSGRDRPLVVATADRNGATVVRPVVDGLIAEIIDKQIDVLIIDPFVSCHEVPENDNTMQDMIVKEWGRVAERGNCAVHLVDHTRKMGAESEVTTESSRGAKSKTDAARVVRAVNRMTGNEGEKAGIENHRLYFRTYNDKANLQPPADRSDWFRLTSVDLGNGPEITIAAGLGRAAGDSVGVVERWEWPDPLADITGSDFDKVADAIRSGRWRKSAQAEDWVGKAVAKALGLNLNNPADKAKVAGLIRVWTTRGLLVEVEGSNAQRKTKTFIEVAEG